MANDAKSGSVGQLVASLLREARILLLQVAGNFMFTQVRRAGPLQTASWACTRPLRNLTGRSFGARLEGRAKLSLFAHLV